MAEQPRLFHTQWRQCKNGCWVNTDIEHRVWSKNECPECGRKRHRRNDMKARADAPVPGWRGAAGVSKFARSSNRMVLRALTEAERKAVKKDTEYWRKVLKTYGLTKLQFLLMFHHQGKACAICRVPFDYAEWRGRRFRCEIDHDHDTGQVRGLLCVNCNRRMAAIDDAEWMRRALPYRAGLLHNGGRFS